MNKKLVLGAIMLLSFFGLTTSNAVAIVSNSYYETTVNIGENISSVNNRFKLDYSGELNNYQIRTRLEFDKGYRFLDLKFKKGIPFLEGLTREKDLSVEDYLLSVTRKENRFDLGLVDPETTSNFLYTDQIAGTYLKMNNYQIWSGYSNPEGLGLSSQNNLQLGVSYNKDSKLLAYQVLEEEEGYNQYLNYSNNFSVSDIYFSLNTITGFNFNDQLKGLANDLRINFGFGDLTYTASVSYSGAEFEAVNSLFDIGYGSYDLNLSTYKRLGSYLLSSNASYSRSNLNKKAENITKDWTTNWQLKYYFSPEISYYGNVNYNLQNTYQTETASLNNQVKDIEFELGTKLKDLSISSNYGQTLTEADSESKIKRSNLGFEVDYNPEETYSLNFNYNLEKENSWSRNYNFDYNYNNQLSSQLDYNLSFNLDKNIRMKINLNQGFQYNLSEVQNLKLDLQLSKYSSGSDISKTCYLQYKYQF